MVLEVICVLKNLTLTFVTHYFWLIWQFFMK